MPRRTLKARRLKRAGSRKQRGGEHYEIDEMDAFFKDARHVIIELDDTPHSKYRTRERARLIDKLNRLSEPAKKYLMFLKRKTAGEPPDNQNEHREYHEYRALKRKFEKFFEFKDKLDPPLSSLINNGQGHSLVGRIGKSIRGVASGISRCCGRRRRVNSPLYEPGRYTDGLGNYDIYSDRFISYEDPHGHGAHGDA